MWAFEWSPNRGGSQIIVSTFPYNDTIHKNGSFIMRANVAHYFRYHKKSRMKTKEREPFMERFLDISHRDDRDAFIPMSIIESIAGMGE